MKLKYWWTEKIGNDEYQQKELVVEGKSVAECHIKFQKETGVKIERCHIEWE